MVRIGVPPGDGADAVRVWQLRPELAKAMYKLSHAVYHESILEPRVREAARMRIAQINDCPV
jgi:alkylhydroperoxidase family enzyme